MAARGPCRAMSRWLLWIPCSSIRPLTWGRHFSAVGTPPCTGSRLAVKNSRSPSKTPGADTELPVFDDQDIYLGG
jgi:hypothetical protein